MHAERIEKRQSPNSHKIPDSAIKTTRRSVSGTNWKNGIVRNVRHMIPLGYIEGTGVDEPVTYHCRAVDEQKRVLSIC